MRSTGKPINLDFVLQMAVDRMALAPNKPVYDLNALGEATSLEMEKWLQLSGAQAEVTGNSRGIGASAPAGGEKGINIWRTSRLAQ